MKFRKALEKAKQQRLAAVQAESNTAGDGDARSGPPQQQWLPPVYAQSKCLAPGNAAIKKNRCVCLFSNAPEQDYYKVLRTQIIQRTQPKGWNTIMITSVRPGEGKSLTAINLALTFAKAYNQTVLLLDCDLRQQSIYRYLDLNSEKSIVDYLQDGQPLKNLIIWPEIEKLTLISGSRTTNDGAELLGSPRMKDLMMEMKQRYEDRYVLVDAQPILCGAETMTLAPLVDAIVIVVDADNTPIKAVQDALDLIPKDKFLGFVLNKHTPRYNRYHDDYRGGT